MTAPFAAAYARIDAAQLALDEARAMLRQAESHADEPLIAAEALAALIGLSVYTVLQNAREKKIPSYKVGNEVRFRYSEVLEAVRR